MRVPRVRIHNLTRTENPMQSNKPVKMRKSKPYNPELAAYKRAVTKRATAWRETASLRAAINGVRCLSGVK